MAEGSPARIDRAALERIIRRAAELQTTEREIGETVTSDELISLGREVGIPVRYLQQAMLEERTRLAQSRADGLFGRVAGPAEVAAQRVVQIEPEAVEPTALQLRYLQTVTEIAAENNSTTIFPIPIEMFRPFMNQAAAAAAKPASLSGEPPGPALPASEISSLMSQMRLQSAKTPSQE